MADGGTGWDSLIQMQRADVTNSASMERWRVNGEAKIVKVAASSMAFWHCGSAGMNPSSVREPWGSS